MATAINVRPFGPTRDMDGSGRPQSHPTNVTVREVHRGSWLKKVEVQGYGLQRFQPKNMALKKMDSYWTIFCIHDDEDPHLEFYPDKKSAAPHKPALSIPLRNCLHISPFLINENENEHTFVLTLSDGIVQLVASSREEMEGWMETLSYQLRSLSILTPKDNNYSKEPVARAPLAPIRDPHSPLPAPPPIPARPPPGTVVERSRSLNEAESSSPATTSPAFRERSLTSGTIVAPPLMQEVPNLSGSQSLRRAQSLQVHPQHICDRFMEISTSSWLHDSSSEYESLALATSGLSESRRSPARSISIPRAASLDSRDRPHTDMREAGGGRSHVVTLTLREQQVAQLKREMIHPAGVRLRLSRRDCLDSVAFVQCFNSVWVAGWKQKERPLLHTAFHIGDRVQRVGSENISTSAQLHRLLKNHPGFMIEVVVERVPHGHVMVIKREHDGQDLGIHCAGGASEIEVVNPLGLAAAQGLTLEAKAVETGLPTKWFITEVNGRPLNLFFKNKEVEARLNAVGKEVSLLVQPVDLISAMKKQLKKISNYKHFIVQ
ncbi:unnamed protein product [Darwinula stevensoni]|uniref:PH domain-containing protein n=1 Tax=Darwinula stevensoni TaxID=69355 RepID=A0A7R9AAV1_9CRUS|nr:unnamed protein product [Darwinula stevensoni]CAG0898464.1 unnamed protein product [Darwinula stevensoni]